MDRARLIDTLGLVTGGMLAITHIELVQWGRDLVFQCRYDTATLDNPMEEPTLFRLVFHDCREIKYKIYAHIAIHEQGEVTPMADVADLSLGYGNHRRDANILTNHFAATISYGSITVETEDRIYDL